MHESAITAPTIAIAVAIIFGLGGLIRGWQMGFQGRLDLITDWDNRPLPNPAEYSKAFSRVYIGLGGAFMVAPLLLLVGLPVLILAGVFACLVWYWFNAIDVIVERARSMKSAPKG